MKAPMPSDRRTFCVTGRVIVSAYIEVEATSEEEAIALAPDVAEREGFSTDQDGTPEWNECWEKHHDD
jgi:hypothetical protein